MATIEQAEQLEQNATINASRDGFEMTIKAGTESGRKTVEALKALNESLKSHRRDRKNKDDEPKQGKVSLKQFTRDAEGRARGSRHRRPQAGGRNYSRAQAPRRGVRC